MACNNENQVIIPLQQRQQDVLLNAVLTAALHRATSAIDSPTPPVPPGFVALGDGEEDRCDETHAASLIHLIDLVLDLVDADDFLPCDDLEL
jgi:hypothetical protein